MNTKRIEELADFFYHSNKSNDVPLRIAIESGMYSGNSLLKQDFIKLMGILSNSKNLKEDLLKYREELDGKE